MKLLHLTLVATTLAVFAVFPSAGCNDKPGIPTEISRTGTVQFVTLEGGFYGIVTDDGHCYDPINLNQELQVDGIRIRFKAVNRNELFSDHMWGDIIELVEVERIIG